MKIVEYDKKYSSSVKDLLLELQEYIVSIDKYKLNVVGDDYRNRYFKKTINEVTSNSGKIYLAIDNDNVVGVIAGYINKYYKSDRLDYTCPKKGIISELVVNKNYRKSGMGEKLIQKMEEFFISQGCEYSELGVFAYNEGAKKFYAKNDYEERMITLFKKLV